MAPQASQRPEPDRIERARAEWAAERPDIDTSPDGDHREDSAAEHLAGTLIRSGLRREGLDRGGFDVLATLRRSGAPYQLTPTRLYEELVLTSGAVTHRVDALERGGLVQRAGGQRDRRSTLVGLTAKGIAVIDAVMGPHMKCEQAMIASLPASGRQALAALLQKLAGSTPARQPDRNARRHRERHQLPDRRRLRDRDRAARRRRPAARLTP